MTLSAKDRDRAQALVTHFENSRSDIELFVNQVRGRIIASKDLFDCIHSIKWRIKEPSHLRDKLYRFIRRAREKQVEFRITPTNLFRKINDLGGVRLLHLYTGQFGAINTALLSALQEEQLPIIEGPVAKTWDDETRTYFKSIGVATEKSDSLYTSVHYVVESNSRTKYTCEIQVRTLAEELWGEVSHTITYPKSIGSIACREQVKVLARMTSGCSRLVDSIFRSREEYLVKMVRKRNRKAPRKKPKSSVRKSK